MRTLPTGRLARKLRRPPRNRQRYLPRLNRPTRRFHDDHTAGLAANRGYFAILKDVDTAPVGGSGIAPNDRIVSRGAAAPLQQAADNGEACPIELQKWSQPSDFLATQQFGVDSMQTHVVASPRVGVTLSVAMKKIEDTALADHGVVVELAF